ncbi:hypothetical protein CROQUDRAFT_714418 [Cronartium quercuum f. sp. fusiforme G11]|uniref:MINDY deubiquitinase domain-containing protein n=1 Tax=Cronartium quercuum f. sp. fusiforme G11 TaxID=708437 RepID=A0A9P6NK91_9BASI|nr:hypothetical protein CROQUDRAFT_714418 [Cronartium quercuum f. sp. fusiforme G11]
MSSPSTRPLIENSTQPPSPTNNPIPHQLTPSQVPASDPIPELEPDTPQPSQPQPTEVIVEKTDERWWIKQIFWPPFPPPGTQPRLVSIIMQNLNGPCSLLAICNILLLRGSINLPGPPNRNSISFQTLSSVLADYLVHHSPDPEHLNTALSVIPSTRTGLNLNPRFGSIDGFGPGSGELSLFTSAAVPLVHGWVADAQDTETWDILVGKCGDYDKAVERVVIGEELFDKPRGGKDDPELSLEEKESIREAFVIRRFLDETRTQLSYSGLFQLASLPRDSLAALFRNSHLSVLYRRPFIPPAPPPPLSAPLPPPPDQIDPEYSHETMLEVHAIAQSLAQVDLERQAQQQVHDDQDGVPKLFNLVTDMSFLNERHIVWESLEDVEGGLSDFYDWDLTRSRLRAPPSRPSGQTAIAHNPIAEPHPPVDPNQLNSDLLCAQQLQEEEYRNQATQRSHPQSEPSRIVQSTSGPHQTLQSHPVSEDYSRQQYNHPGTSTQSTSQVSSSIGSGQGRRVSSGGGSHRKKKDCKIM